MAEFYNVNDYATPAAAVAAAHTDGEQLFWPAGSYAVGTSISNFHDVAHFGPGEITRSGQTFYISPKTNETNTLFVNASSGSDSNDGLSSGTALKTLQKAADILNEWADGGLKGRWEIEAAAGTYSKIVFNNELRSEYAITLSGPDTTSDWNSSDWIANSGRANMTPTAIIDDGGSPSDTGISVGPFTRVIVNDIKVRGFTTGNAASNNTGWMTFNNVHVEDCQDGIVAIHGAFTSVNGGYFDGNDRGGDGYVALYNSTHNIETENLNDAALFENWTEGLQIGEGCQGHLDYTRLRNNGTGVRFTRGAGACNTKQMEIYDNDVGLIAENNGWFNNNIDFGTGGNANTVNVKAYNSPEFDMTASDNTGRTLRMLQITNVAAHTGTTANTLLYTSPSIRDWCISEGGHLTRIVAFGTSTLSSNCSIYFYLNDGTSDYIGGVVVPAGVTDFKVSCDVHYTAANAQRSLVALVGNGDVNRADYSTGNRSLKNSDHTVRLQAKLNSTTDVITFSSVRTETTAGG